MFTIDWQSTQVPPPGQYWPSQAWLWPAGEGVPADVLIAIFGTWSVAPMVEGTWSLTEVTP